MINSHERHADHNTMSCRERNTGEENEMRNEYHDSQLQSCRYCTAVDNASQSFASKPYHSPNPYLNPGPVRVGVIAGPLEMLYEFGKLDCQHSNGTKSGPVPTDELRRPIVLLGPQTSSIGSTNCLTEDWHNETAANHVHTVLEGCDPATGIR